MDRLTKYEYARIIGIRAEQIASGAEPFVLVGSLMDPVKIAEKELSEGKIPLELIRRIQGKQRIIKLTNIKGLKTFS